MLGEQPGEFLLEFCATKEGTLYHSIFGRIPTKIFVVEFARKEAIAIVVEINSYPSGYRDPLACPMNGTP